MTSSKKKQFLFIACLLAARLLTAGPGKDLIAYFSFSGDCNDSVSGAHGFTSGGKFTKDRFGNPNSAYHFDGKNDYISLGTTLNLRREVMSISLWLKIDDFSSNNMNYPGTPFISTRANDRPQFYEAYLLGFENPGHRFAGACHSSQGQEVAVFSASAADTGKWHHLVYMFDHDSVYLYLDGLRQKTKYKGFVTGYLLPDSVLLGRVGNHQPESEYYNYSYFKGCLDEIRFFDRVLESHEVAAVFNASAAMEKAAGLPQTAPLFLMQMLRTFWYLPLAFLLLIGLILVAVRVRLRNVRRHEREKSLLQRQVLQSEMKALRSQMNPHFIFNAINSIQHYVLTNEKELANRYLVKFSKLMRNILDLSKEELIPLKDELETVRLYLEIEALRFNNAFNFSIECAPDIDQQGIELPPLLIQPFVENAIWHGLLLKEGDKVLKIKISRRSDTVLIQIEDNGIGRAAAEKFRNKEFNRKSLGMEITSSRLDAVRRGNKINITYDVVDNESPEGKPAGTVVIIKLHKV